MNLILLSPSSAGNFNSSEVHRSNVAAGDFRTGLAGRTNLRKGIMSEGMEHNTDMAERQPHHGGITAADGLHGVKFMILDRIGSGFSHRVSACDVIQYLIPAHGAEADDGFTHALKDADFPAVPVCQSCRGTNQVLSAVQKFLLHGLHPGVFRGSDD